MSEVLEPDLCVIGAGAAGLSAAAIAASFGVQVVLIEKDAAGESRGEGADVARNALIAAGARRHAVRGASRFGIGRGRSDPVVDFARVRDHARGAAKTLAPNDALERYVAMGVRVVRGAGAVHGPAHRRGRRSTSGRAVSSSRPARARRCRRSRDLPACPASPTRPSFEPRGEAHAAHRHRGRRPAGSRSPRPIAASARTSRSSPPPAGYCPRKTRRWRG